ASNGYCCWGPFLRHPALRRWTNHVRRRTAESRRPLEPRRRRRGLRRSRRGKQTFETVGLLHLRPGGVWNAVLVGPRYLALKRLHVTTRRESTERRYGTVTVKHARGA